MSQISSLPLIRRRNNNVTTWIRKPAGSILPPDILDIVILYAEGYKEIKYLLPGLLADIKSPHYIMLYETVYRFGTGIVTLANRVSRYQVCGDISPLVDVYENENRFDEAEYFHELNQKILFNSETIRILHLKFGVDYLIEAPLN